MSRILGAIQRAEGATLDNQTFDSAGEEFGVSRATLQRERAKRGDNLAGLLIKADGSGFVMFNDLLKRSK